MTEKDNARDMSRRTVLKGTAATGAIAGFPGTAGGYREILQELEVEQTAQNQNVARSFSLLGIVGGWTGIGPAEIDARTNPPLRVVEGEEYEVFWVNGDGNSHNFNLQNADGEVVQSTGIIEEQGESETLTFTASPELSEYFCGPHPVSMRGPIELVEPTDVHQLTVNLKKADGSPLVADVAVEFDPDRAVDWATDKLLDAQTYRGLSDRLDEVERLVELVATGEIDVETARDVVVRRMLDDGLDPDTIVDEAGLGATAVNVDGDIDERFGPYAAFSDVLARGGASEQRGIARFDTLGDGPYTVTTWTYGYEMTTKDVTIDGADKEITITVPEVKPGEPATVYELTLREGYWQGDAPDEIAGERNPTLTVTPGETYRVRWNNTLGRKDIDEGSMQGEPLPGHNFVVARQNRNTILRSEFLDEEGASQTVDFVAEEDLGVYLDQSQLEAMGEITVEDGGSDG